MSKSIQKSLHPMKAKYLNEMVPQLVETFGFSNPMMVPSIQAITLNMGRKHDKKKIIE